MSSEFALDLRLARRKAGFTQRDIAHLLSAHQSAVSALERGQTNPSLIEIVALSLIFGRSFESLFADLMRDVRRDLIERLAALPADVRDYVGTFNRASSISSLRRRLSAEQPVYGGS